MRKVAGIQFRGDVDKEANIKKATEFIREAAGEGANIVCLQELFNMVYPGYEQKEEYFELAETIPGPTIDRMSALAKELAIVLIAPIYEKVLRGKYYNTAVLLGRDGKIIGKYRKSHVPLTFRLEFSGTYANEKLYFTPGDTGFQVFPTPFGINVGLIICADRHYPEAGRILGLKGADVIFIPNASSSRATLYAWEIDLRSLAMHNLVYVVGVNRVGSDRGESPRNWFGTSMIVSPEGEIIARAGDKKDEIIYADIDLTLIDKVRNQWGFYRDRRPDLYGELVK
jgi:beta-ureidopropionase